MDQEVGEVMLGKALELEELPTESTCRETWMIRYYTHLIYRQLVAIEELCRQVEEKGKEVAGDSE